MVDATAPEVTIVPANEASWEDLQAVFGTRGDRPGASASGTRCARESWASVPAEERRPPAARADRLRPPGVGHDQRPRRLPRRRARRLVRGRAAHRLPAPGAQQPRPLGGPRGGQDRRQRLGRDLLRHPRGLPGRGISRALARAAVDFARRTRRPRARGLPDDHAPGQEITWGELHVGSRSIFAAAGFTEVSRPTLRRVVMRIDFQPGRRACGLSPPASYLNEMPRRTR